MSQRLDYRAAAYRPVAAWRRWWPLAWQEATVLFKTRWGVALFCFCMLPALVRLAMLLILFGVINFGPQTLRGRMLGGRRPRGEMAALDPQQVDFYVSSVLQAMPGMVFALLLTTLVVARSVARDRTTNALELYWTRGITPWSYLLAKWVGSLMLLSAMTVWAPFALWLTAGFLAEDWSLLADTWQQFGLAMLGLLLASAVWTGIGVLVSASCATPNAAMVLWCILIVGSSAMSGVLGFALRSPTLRTSLSVWEAGGVLVRSLASLPQRDASLPFALTTLGVVTAVAWWRARRHLRVAEAMQ